MKLKKNNLKDLIGFSLDEDHLKITHVHVSNLKREVVSLISHEVRGMSDQDISVFIRQSLGVLNLKNPPVFLAVPLHLVITRSIEVPSRDPEEIREIVNLQASRHTPYSRAEIIIDLLDLGVVHDSYTRVLLVIVPKEVVGRQMKILEAANLEVEKVFFPPEGVCQAFTKILSGEYAHSVVGIIHMDFGFTSFIVIQNGKILFVRGIPVGASHLLDEGEVSKDRFIDELQRSLEAYTADELGPAPKLFYLTGVAADTSDLDGLFSDTLQSTIRHQSYFNTFSISNQARQVAVASKRLSFFDLIAPLLLFDRMKVDLTSEEKKLKIQLEERGKQMLKTGVLAMMLLSLLCAIFLSKLYFQSHYLHRLTDRYRPIIEEAKGLEQTYSKTQIVKDYLAGRGQSLQTLMELYETIPDDVRLGNIKYEEGQKFSVKGTSGTMASVFTFVTNLEKSNKFKNVKTKYVTNRNENGVDLADFEISCLVGEK